MGKRGPKKGQGGRPHGGNHSEEQRREWRLRKIKAKQKMDKRKQLEQEHHRLYHDNVDLKKQILTYKQRYGSLV